MLLIVPEEAHPLGSEDATKTNEPPKSASTRFIPLPIQLEKSQLVIDRQIQKMKREQEEPLDITHHPVTIIISNTAGAWRE